MSQNINQFDELFRKYKLKAEFLTLSEFSSALADKGFIYEESIFSHWQKGDRIPQHRAVLLKILEIFMERKAITTIDQANSFMSSADQGYLSEKELENLPVKLETPVFQVPNQISNFSNRQELIKEIIQQKIQGKIIFIHGLSGVGKTAIAIQLGHMLKERFTDGILWYKVEKDNIMDILLSIARIYGEDISTINDLHVRSTVVRSILASKNALLFLDSAEALENIQLLIPSSHFSTTIITSQKNQLKIAQPYIDISIHPFSNNEALDFFKKILYSKYPQDQEKTLIKVAKRVGNLPFSLHLIAQQLLYSDEYLTHLPKVLEQENSFFPNLYKEDQNLYVAIAVSYKNLTHDLKDILVSASIFKGKDFSAKSIAYINGLSIQKTTEALQRLIDFSLVEYSTKGRYRMHPAIQEFVRDKLNYPKSSYLLKIAYIFFLFFAFWWISIQLFTSKNSLSGQLFTGLYSTMALYGGIYGIQTAFKWGGLKTLIGRSIFMFSIGLFMQVIGQVLYTYFYVILGNPNPYPSFGDIGFFGTIPFYTYGVLLLAKSSGIKVSIQSFKKKLIALVIPLIMLIIAYLIFLRDYVINFSNPIKTFLDFGYPLGESFYISIALITFIFSRKIFDGIMKSRALLVLVALVAQFIADYIFLYSPSNFYPGNYMDLLYLIAYFIMTIALLNLKSIFVKVTN